MVALIGLGISLLCLYLVNVGWKTRQVEGPGRACVFGAYWVSGSVLLISCALTPSVLIPTAAFCLLLFLGTMTNLSPRWMRYCSCFIVLGFWLWAFVSLAWIIPQQMHWKRETAFESMEQRVPEPRPEFASWRLTSSTSTTSTTNLLYEFRRGHDERVRSIQVLHNDTLAVFNQAAGFGRIRMMVIHPLAEHFLPDAVQPIRQKLDHVAELVSTGLNSSGLKSRDVETMNSLSTVDFVNQPGFGWVKSRTEVAGFRPHRFSKWPDAPQTWDVKRIDLVSLLLHDEPVVYVSNDLPRMADVGKLATRELDTFEKDGLAAIRKGEDLYIRGDAEKVRVIGSMRNIDQCIKCHGGQGGDLLGAFSYVLLRKPIEK